MLSLRSCFSDRRCDQAGVGDLRAPEEERLQGRESREIPEAIVAHARPEQVQRLQLAQLAQVHQASVAHLGLPEVQVAEGPDPADDRQLLVPDGRPVEVDAHHRVTGPVRIALQRSAQPRDQRLGGRIRRRSARRRHQAQDHQQRSSHRTHVGSLVGGRRRDGLP